MCNQTFVSYLFRVGCLGLLLSSSLFSLAFEPPSWDKNIRFEFLRRMGTAPSGGADIGECLEIAQQAEGNNRSSKLDQTLSYITK